MNPDGYAHLLEGLELGPLTVPAAVARIRELGSTWSEDQLCLFVECMAGVELDTNVDPPVVRLGARSHEDELAAALVNAIGAFGDRPVPAAQLRQRLPAQFTTTDEQVKAIARRTPGLEIVGPGLVRRSP